MSKHKQENIRSILNDEDIAKELIYRSIRKSGTDKSRAYHVSLETLRGIIQSKDMESLSTRPLTEAIILDYGRPALLVKQGTYVIPESDAWKERLAPSRSVINKAIGSVGRIELEGHPDFPWVGTGWQVAENIIITNRHVAQTFAQKKGEKFVFKMGVSGDTIKARIDYKEEYQVSVSSEFEVEKILYVSPDTDRDPDYAFLKLKSSHRLPAPIPLLSSAVDMGEYIACIGYPAKDGRRNDEDVMNKIFGDIYNVKRFQPGTITNFPKSGFIFNHDCSTLGGNSGSVVIDIDSGFAAGIHFGGMFHEKNFAVKSTQILKALDKLKVRVAVDREAVAAIEEEKPEVTRDLSDRTGYDPDFLGKSVALPSLDKWGDSVLKFREKNKNKTALDYTHFSVVMNKDRRMAFFSACNIDGNDWYQVPRKSRAEQWYYDDRIDKKYQCGNDIYANNDLDRGHLTRREDPLWGGKAQAIVANEDTFHFTNACPQHKDLNQKTWLGLERYILDNAKAHELRVSVFTGPVFRPTDPKYRGIKIPKEFWKVISIVREDTGKLSVTAYVLSHADKLVDLEEFPEFVYGAYKTYQIPVRELERMTKLDFGNLKKFDPLDANAEEALGAGMKPLESLDAIVL